MGIKQAKQLEDSTYPKLPIVGKENQTEFCLNKACIFFSYCGEMIHFGKAVKILKVFHFLEYSTDDHFTSLKKAHLLLYILL